MTEFNTAFSIGNVSLTWNAIILAASIFVAVLVSHILVKKRGVYKDLALDACIVGIPLGLFGGRLFSAISGKTAFSAFFNLGASGLNLPGALLFAGIGIAVYARIKKLSLAEVFDVLAPGAFFGLALGRWSDFFLCEGLGPKVQSDALKFFPLSTFTEQYFSDGTTVAYSVFFLDFLVCLAIAISALFMLKKCKKGTASRISVITWLFCEFILEWLRDDGMSPRQIVFGDVRFNQIVLVAMLLFFVGLSLYLARRESAPTPEQTAEDTAEEPEEQTTEDAAEETTEEETEGNAVEIDETIKETATEVNDA